MLLAAGARVDYRGLVVRGQAPPPVAASIAPEVAPADTDDDDEDKDDN